MTNAGRFASLVGFVGIAALGCSSEDSSGSSGKTTDPMILPVTLPTVPCRYIVPQSVEGTTFHCGDLPVPENRAKDGSRMITIHVIVFSGKKGGVPTIVLQGGPGGSAEEEVTGLSIGDPTIARRYQPFLDQGDVVFFDQRGAGRSIPRLTCVPEADAGVADPAGVCFARHVKAGVDFAGYDSPASADDVDELRLSLGAPKANLYGISYGSRLALEVMRRHPDQIRAAAIDGVLPPQIKIFTETMPNLDATVTKIIAACAADAKCNAAYPDLEGGLVKLKAKLDAMPFGSGQDTFDWKAFVGVVFDTLYSQGAAGQFPYFVTKLNAQSQAEWAADQNAMATKATAENKQRMEALAAMPLGKEVFDRLKGKDGALHQEIIDDLAFAMYAAVSCADSGQYETLDGALAALSKVRADFRSFGESEARSAFAGCRELPAIAPKSKVTDAVMASIPTIVIGGGFDPITPASNAMLAAGTLSGSQLIVVPGGAHGFVDDCGNGLKGSFVSTLKPVDATCATSEKITFYYAPAGFGPGMLSLGGLGGLGGLGVGRASLRRRADRFDQHGELIGRRTRGDRLQ
jgi:pimeloyl-ACP methyl ester carboxylesterase